MDTDGRRFITKNIVLGNDGVYRWVYELSMFSNPVIFITVCKVLAISVGAVYLFVMLISLSDGIESLLEITKVFAILFAVLLVIACIACLIIAGAYGGKYIVAFEMDEEKIVHIQLPSQFEKAQVMSMIAFAVSAARGNYGAAGGSLIAASRSTSTSEFAKVKKVTAKRRQELIKVNQTLSKNQIYAEPEDYDFVLDFISRRCINARVK